MAKKVIPKKKVTPKKVAPKKVEPKKVAPKKVEAKKAIPVLEKEFKDIGKKFKSTDKRVESLGNKFDKNPSNVNQKALLAAIRTRDDLKIQKIQSELTLLKTKLGPKK